MKEPENKNNSQVKLIASIVLLNIFISVITLSIVIKTLIPVSATPTSIPISTIQPTFTLTFTQTPVVQTPIHPSYDNALTPMQIQMPRIESNLLQNSGFENGLSEWTYSDNDAGINVFETAGVNGKAFCSRRYVYNKDLLEKEWAGFVQEVAIEPNQAYFFSGWVKLDKAVNVYPMARLYNWSENAGWALATHGSIGRMPDGETTNGWVFIHGEIPALPIRMNRAIFGFWHGLIYDAPNGIDSTICVDDLVFSKITR